MNEATASHVVIQVLRASSYGYQDGFKRHVLHRGMKLRRAFHGNSAKESLQPKKKKQLSEMKVTAPCTHRAGVL